MKTGMKSWYFAAAIAAGIFAFAANEASAATCTGTSNSANPTMILYNANTDVCSISDTASVPGIDNIFAMVLNPTVGPNRYLGIKFLGGPSHLPTDSLIVNGIVGTAAATANAVHHDFTGAVVALILADLYGKTYGMVANLVADGGQNITLINAWVSEVPLPAALPLFAAALGGFRLIGRRRRRRTQAAAA